MDQDLILTARNNSLFIKDRKRAIRELIINDRYTRSQLINVGISAELIDDAVNEIQNNNIWNRQYFLRKNIVRPQPSMNRETEETEEEDYVYSNSNSNVNNGQNGGRRKASRKSRKASRKSYKPGRKASRKTRKARRKTRKARRANRR